MQHHQIYGNNLPSLQQRIEIIAVLLDQVLELAAWIEIDVKSATVIKVMMMHVESARSIADSSEMPTRLSS